MGMHFSFTFFSPTGDMTRLLFFPLQVPANCFHESQHFHKQFRRLFHQKKKLYFHTQTFCSLALKVFSFHFSAGRLQHRYVHSGKRANAALILDE